MKKILIVGVIVLMLLAACQKGPEVSQMVPEEPITESALAQGLEVSLKEPDLLEETMSDEIRLLLQNTSKKVNSLSYQYRGPETRNTLYSVYLKGVKMAFVPDEKNDYSGETDYNIFFLDGSTKTAAAYCTHQTCMPRGKHVTLDYEDIYFATPLDWLVGITSAEKLQEAKLERRDVMVVATNKGKMWVDEFFGVPMKVEQNGTTYMYERMAFNAVKDEQVSP